DILGDKEEHSKVLIFTANKKQADMVFERLDAAFTDECTVIHSNKTQNYRLRSIRQFGDGFCRILIATDVMARGLDIEQISDVINFDTPAFPENYIHRIGRTGRAEKKGRTYLFTTPGETEYLEEIEALMEMKIPKFSIPTSVEISTVLIPEEQPDMPEVNNPSKKSDQYTPGASHHEKSEKNSKVNLGGSYRREIAKKYKKPKTRGDKNYNRRKKK
ncbi:MAG TPA: helicase-related protein, partial [Salinimicrobium sp.]|nr:helicase-related protein [Salinimicrobium sp.]